MCENDKNILRLIAANSKLNERNQGKLLCYAHQLAREERGETEKEEIRCGMRICSKLSDIFECTIDDLYGRGGGA